jgi:hypothetical protein
MTGRRRGGKEEVAHGCCLSNKPLAKKTLKTVYRSAASSISEIKVSSCLDKSSSAGHEINTVGVRRQQQCVERAPAGASQYLVWVTAVFMKQGSNLF